MNIKQILKKRYILTSKERCQIIPNLKNDQDSLNLKWMLIRDELRSLKNNINLINNYQDKIKSIEQYFNQYPQLKPYIQSQLEVNNLIKEVIV